MVGQMRTGKWRYRLPGGHVERGGFETREQASAALDDALAGRDWKLLQLHRAVKRAVRIEDLVRTARTELLIDDARMRRSAARAARAAAGEREGGRT